MRKTLVAAVLVCAAFAPTMAAAKVLVVRSNDLVRESPQFKAADAKMKTEFDRKKNDLENQAKAFDDKVKDYRKESVTLSADAKSKREKDLMTQQLDLQNADRKFREELANRDRELFTDVMQKIRVVMEQVAKEKGADVVLENPAYFKPELDITDDVLKRLSQGGK